MSDAKSQISPATWRELRQGLADWYAAAKRPLPWRTEVSLYRTVVSEFMCQQTQIDTVLPYFHRWMAKFPDFVALARADEDAVLTAWSGLGYYARARNLHRLAQALAAADPLPETPEAWRRLPGIGPYTAAAICSIVFQHPAAVVDGNVIRVLARLRGISQCFSGNQAAAKVIQPLADAFLDPVHPGNHNQAVMELGATLCSKHRPSCLLCPLRAPCRSADSPDLPNIPKIARRKSEKVVVYRLWHVREGRILLHRQPGNGQRLARLAELPEWPAELPLSQGTLLAKKCRGISHQQIQECILAAPRGISPSTCADFEYVSLEDLENFPLSGPHRRWISEIRAQNT